MSSKTSEIEVNEKSNEAITEMKVGRPKKRFYRSRAHVSIFSPIYL
jgi:hypothetical protein